MEEAIVKKFLQEQTDKIKPLYINLQYAFWDAITTGKKEAYEKYELYQKEMARFFNNPENFRKVKQFLDLGIKDRLIERQLIVLYNSYLGSQGDINLINKILEKSTAIEQKFNIFRAKINGKELTDNDIKDILRKEKDSRKLQEAWEANKTQGEAVAKDLIELIKLRNQLAKSLGFRNYYDFSLEVNEQTEEEVTALYERLEKDSRAAFIEIKKEIDKALAERYNTRDLKPWHYQDLFFQEPPKVYKIDFDGFYKEDFLGKAQKFYSSIGLDVSDILKKSDLYEKPGKNQHAYSADMDRAGDVRTFMNIKNNRRWAETILHELGHSVYSKYIDRKLPFLIRDQSHILISEAIAQLFERNSENTSFIKEFCNVKPEEIDRLSEKIGKTLQMKELIVARWSQVMVNFERKLYENPEQNLNKLWWELVKRYQLIDFSRDKADWASKIHLVSAPVYYQNYLIGELYASQINNYIAKNILGKASLKNLKYSGEKKIGNYLREKIFFPGLTYRWDELIEYSTGEKLNPKYWIEEFC
jgi:peptidyl-dipeptidase A